MGMTVEIIKDERIALRLTQEQKATITSAAMVLGQNVTDFTVRTTVARAEEVLADQRIFHADAEGWTRLNELMAAPVEPNPGLADLFATPSVFAVS
jgi:uncharacterized protein (DUF1778 family)